MFAWSNNVLRKEDGHAALEFAFLLPMLMLILVVVLDLGRALYTATAIEKGLRSAAVFAAQSAHPLTQATRTAAENLAKTGNPNGQAPYLVEGWGDEAARLQIETRTFTVDEMMLPVVRLEAAVPYRPLLSGLFQLHGFSAITIELAHEQAYIGY